MCALMISHDPATTSIASADQQHSNNVHSPASSASSSNHNHTTTKRTSSQAGMADGQPAKPVKRRAAKACAACRSRKVRCDVMQRYHITADGEVTCSNCTMDGIKCVIEESKRRKKHLNGQPLPAAPLTVSGMGHQSWNHVEGGVNPSDITNPERRWSGSTSLSNELPGDGISNSHVPHPIYQNVSDQIINKRDLQRPGFLNPLFDPSEATFSLLTSASIHGDRTRTRLASPPPLTPALPQLKHKLPDYLTPLPARMTSVDIDYLFAKGALSLPQTNLRDALLRSFFEYVHPYMPLVEIHELLRIINEGTGESGRVSLLLFQAIMFAGTAFVDMEHLRNSGFSNRKSARKAFFQRARVLYDFDYEVDRVALVQSLLLMTYWYETPDDQKDTWHWMGVAISLAHTIGLHRNPANSNMEPSKKKLWKRIWWSCFMRDRLVALGMRRPTRVKDEDYDVPMLTEEDFELESLPESNTILPLDCALARDVEAQAQLARMCIAKAKLCLCISHVLSAQYSVLIKHQGMQVQEGSARSSVMLFPKKLDQTDEVRRCDLELSNWVDELPPECVYSDEIRPDSSGPPLFVQRALLLMIYYTTLSALHRPQVLPSATTTTSQIDQSRELQDLSRKKVREASREITRISQDLHTRDLEKFLPTTGVTVLLPAIIIHLLDIKSCNDEARQAAMDGYCQCMAVLEKLRDNYASADFATQFLEAAIRKAEIDVLIGAWREKLRREEAQARLVASRQQLAANNADRHTPPLSSDELGLDTGFRPDLNGSGMMDIGIPIGNPVGVKNPLHHALAAHTPPDSDSNTDLSSTQHPANTIDGFNSTAGGAGNFSFNTAPLADGNLDLNDFLNFDNGDGIWNVPFEEGAHGESGGFMGDMNWIEQLPGWSRMGSPAVDEGLFGVVEGKAGEVGEVGA